MESTEPVRKDETHFLFLDSSINAYIYIYIESVLIGPNSCNSQKKWFLYMLGERCFECFPSCTKSCFLVLSLVPKIVLFGAFPRAKNCALDRAFWCSPSCPKSCFLVLSFVHWLLSFVQTSCYRSCFLVLSFVPQIVLFGAVPRAKNRALDRAFWCSPSCQKSCSRSCFLLQLLGLCLYIYILIIHICIYIYILRYYNIFYYYIILYYIYICIVL